MDVYHRAEVDYCPTSNFNHLIFINLITGKCKKNKINKKCVRRPGIEPGSTAWKATMLTVTPPTHSQGKVVNKLYILTFCLRHIMTKGKLYIIVILHIILHII